MHINTFEEYLFRNFFHYTTFHLRPYFTVECTFVLDCSAVSNGEECSTSTILVKEYTHSTTIYNEYTIRYMIMGYDYEEIRAFAFTQFTISAAAAMYFGSGCGGSTMMRMITTTTVTRTRTL